MYDRSCLSKILALTSLIVTATSLGRATPLPPTLFLATSLSNLGANDLTNWSQLGADQTAVPAGFTATSAAGVKVTGTFQGGNAGGLTAVDCPAAPSCTWTGGAHSGDRCRLTHSVGVPRSIHGADTSRSHQLCRKHHVYRTERC
jgi:hypothetical protein